MERTFIAIKPDGVKRALIGRIISRFEDKGFKLVAMKMLHATEELAAKHYEEHIGKPFYDRLVTYITSGPIVAMVWEGVDVVNSARKLMGATSPSNAEVGSIRFDFAQTMEFNIIHGSDSPQSAEREMNIYFTQQELCNNWKRLPEILADEEK